MHNNETRSFIYVWPIRGRLKTAPMLMILTIFFDVQFSLSLDIINANYKLVLA
jgi:hypothetical protein